MASEFLKEEDEESALRELEEAFKLDSHKLQKNECSLTDLNNAITDPQVAQYPAPVRLV